MAFTEIAENGNVDRHFAFVLISAQHVDMSSLDLGNWQSNEITGLILLLIAYPLSSNPPPQLPDPVRPDSAPLRDIKPVVPPPTSTSMPLLETFGVTADFLAGLEGKTALIYPGHEGLTDRLHAYLHTAFREVKALPADSPDILVVFNQKLTKVLRSSTVRATLPRRTRIYALGPSHDLLPSQWRLRPIWQTGGLVTFSPTFILRSPTRFTEIMKVIRMSDTWGAYVLPSVIEWANLSWKEPA